jgi:hypothetical protein
VFVLLALLWSPELMGELRVSDDDVPTVESELSEYLRWLVVELPIVEFNMSAFGVDGSSEHSRPQRDQVTNERQGKADCWDALAPVEVVSIVHDEDLLVEDKVGESQE